MLQLVGKCWNLPPVHLKTNTWPMIEINEGTAVAPSPGKNLDSFTLEKMRKSGSMNINAQMFTSVICIRICWRRTIPIPRTSMEGQSPLHRVPQADSNMNVYSGDGGKWEDTFFRSMNKLFLLKELVRDHTQKWHDFYLCDSIMRRKGFTTDPRGPQDPYMGPASPEQPASKSCKQHLTSI